MDHKEATLPVKDLPADLLEVRGIVGLGDRPPPAESRQILGAKALLLLLLSAIL